MNSMNLLPQSGKSTLLPPSKYDINTIFKDTHRKLRRADSRRRRLRREGMVLYTECICHLTETKDDGNVYA